MATPAAPPYRYDDLSAPYLDCTLKRSPEVSDTEGLIGRSRSVMEVQGVTTSLVRPVDLDLATGAWPDMTEHGWASDAWPEPYGRATAADILVLCGPIRVGDTCHRCGAMRVIGWPAPRPMARRPVLPPDEARQWTGSSAGPSGGIVDVGSRVCLTG
ncbi:hypothetical protein SAMN05428939_6959 [Streptomyces sp. TLI_105]|nr:hypothetical protein SAMN05428939_6959 [Streptomyces sp. TLI_105]